MCIFDVSFIMKKKKDWFVDWFDTRYYHILYQHRNIIEAQEFMQHLVSFLQVDKEHLLLDLACGKGRHSIYLNSLGYQVIGADLSQNNIKMAKIFENERLHFKKHDMRHRFKTKFNFILNLFTSFGFFDDDMDDIKILRNIKNGLKPDGIAVIDFMNTPKVIQNLIPVEVITLDGIQFNITRYVKNGFIVKEINFDADGKHHTYYEKVKNLDLDKIKSYIDTVGFKIKHIFGNYQLDSFDEDSDRLILIIA